jgi:glyoxylase-like metal-dependent hydrolase (beta-lactamase superfamily II)
MLRYETVPVTAFAQNCSIVWCDRTLHAAVIDPGGELPRLRAATAALGVTLKAIWLTHAHIDHAGGAGQLAREDRLPIVGPHAGDRFWIDALAQQSKMFGFPPAEGFEPARWLAEGDTVQVGDCVLAVHHCPGHTPGHVVFHSAPARCVFVGDVLFAGSVGRTDLPGGDFDTLAASIRSRLWTLPDDTVFVPGHGPEGRIGEERRTNPFVGTN